jgi:hypothetical protein
MQAHAPLPVIAAVDGSTTQGVLDRANCPIAVGQIGPEAGR